MHIINPYRFFEVYGVKTRCLSFDGNDYVDCGLSTSNYDIADGYTIEAWIYPTAEETLHIFTHDSTIAPSSERYWQFYYGDNDEKRVQLIRFDASNNVVAYVKSAISEIQINTWNHVAAVFDASVGSQIYVNGNESGDLNTVKTNNHSGASNYHNVLIGARRHGSVTGFWKGKLDEIRLWNYPRTKAQIQQYMNYMLTGLEPGLISYYSMNLGTGGSLPDNQEDGAHVGTIVGATWLTE